MKSVADLIANKNALIKRDKRGKITAASLTAAGAAVLAAAQAEAQDVQGFEDITSSVISFERVGNGQIEFELENGQRFIANEGQYIIEGNQILVSQELVTIVGGAGLNPTVIAVGVAGAALVVGALILMNSEDDDDATTTTTTTTTTTPGTTTNITSASTGEATGTAGSDTFTVTDTSALNAITAINGGDGTDTVSITEILEPDTSPTLDLGSRGVTLTDVEQFSVTVDAGTTLETATLNMGGETAAVTVSNTDSSTGTIVIEELGPSASGGTAATLTLVDIEGGQVVDVDTDSGVSKLTANIQNAGDSASDPMALEIDDSGETITELTVSSDGSSSNFLQIKASVSTVELDIDGSENLTLADTVGAGDMSGIATLDAGDASGNIVVSVDSTVTSLTMGSGNDTVTAISGLTATATFDGGTGEDTLDLQDQDTSSATISGFETLIASGASASTLDFTNISDVDEVIVNGTSVVTLDNVADGDIADQVSFADGAKVEFTNATETSMTLVGASGAGGDIQIDNASTALTEIVVQQEDDGVITLLDTNTDSLFVTGNEAATIAGAGAVALTSVDVSGAASLVATANPFTAIDSYTGSGGIDDVDIAGVAANATILTGASDDDVTFTTAATNGNGANVSLGSGDDTVTLPDEMTAGTITLDGGVGDDTFDLGTGNVAVTIEINAGDNAVSLSGGVVQISEAESVSDFTAGSGAGGDVVDLSSLNLTGPIVTIDASGGAAAAYANAYDDIMDDDDDIIYIDGTGSGSITHLFYDNGAGGVGVIDFGAGLTLDITDGVDVDF